MGTSHHKEGIADHIASILELLGLDLGVDPELTRTPDRVAQMCQEMIRAMSQQPPDIGVMENPDVSGEMILVRELPFYSVCAHHLIPFFGQAHIGYVPKNKIAGFSGLARVLRHFAARPQLQERLTVAVADHVQGMLGPEGVIVHVRARHLCLEMRGERVPGFIETTAARRVFERGPLREEFFTRILGLTG